MRLTIHATSTWMKAVNTPVILKGWPTDYPGTALLSSLYLGGGSVLRAAVDRS
jgi:hypothetical protein